jgi:hypothetical protein
MDTEPTTISLDQLDERSSLLDYARRLTTDKTNPAAVTANAAALLDWVRHEDPQVRELRLTALYHADACRGFGREPDNDPHALITEAATYHAFLIRDGLTHAPGV